MSDIFDDKYIRILLVDDDEDFLKTAKEILEMKNNFEVTNAFSVNSALKKLKEVSFDVVVSDYEMPEKTGIDLLSKLRSQGSGLPFILFTGKGREEVAIRALNLGADRYVNKIGNTKTVYGELIHGILQVVEKKKTETNYRAFIENTNEAIVVVLDAKIVYVNSMSKEISGFDSNELLGKSILDFIDPADHERVMKRYLSKVKGEEVPRLIQFRILTKKGKIKWVETNAVLMTWEGKVGVLNFITDITERKIAEEKLKESEQRYKIFVDNSDQAIMVYQDYSYKFANKRAETLLGYTNKELVSKNPLSFIHPDDMEQVKVIAEKLEEARQTGKDLGETFSFRIVTKNGEVKWIELKSTNTIWNGKSAGLSFFTDITRYKESESILKANESRFRILFESTPSSSVLFDSKGNILLCNLEFTKMHKTKGGPENQIGRNISEFFSKEDIPILESIIATSMKTGKSTGKIKFTLLRDDGTPFVAETFSSVIKDDDGNPIGIIGQAIDITKSLELQEALRTSEANYRTLAENTTQIIVVVLDGKLVYVNPRAEELSGFDSKDLIGTSFLDFVHPDDRERVMERHLKRLKGERIPHLAQFKILTRTGGVKWIETNAVPIKWGHKNAILNFASDITERKITEEQLKESQERFRKFFENAPDYMYMISPDGKILDINKSALQRLGYNKDEMVGKSFLKIYTLPSQSEAKRLFRTWKKTGRIKDQVLEISTKSGDTRTILLSADSVKDPNGDLLYSTSVHKDITDYVKAQDKLERSEKRFREISELLPAIIFETDLNGSFTFVNNIAYDKFGYSEDDLKKGVNITQMVIPSDQKRAINNFTKVLKRDTVMPNEYTAVAKDGSTFPAMIYSSPIIIDDKPIGIRGVVVDITKRKEIEIDCENSKEDLMRIIDQSPNGIIFFNIEGICTEINPAALAVSGFKKEEVIGKHFSEIGVLYTRGIPRYTDLYTSILNGKELGPIEVEWKTKSGDHHFAEVRFGLIKKEDKPVGIQVLTVDITKRQRAIKSMEDMMVSLSRANEKLSVVGKLIRHDIRNKLTTAKNNFYLLNQKISSNSKLLKYMRGIELACYQIERILDFSRVYEKIGSEKLAFTNVDKSFKEAIGLFSDLGGVEILCEVEDVWVVADSLLRHLFYNLIDNSLKYGENISCIRLFLEQIKADKVHLVYEDNGIGIPESEKQKIFVEGYGKGTGYGLYLIKKMCEVYNWTIKENGNYGVGSRFIITINRNKVKLN